MCIKSSSISSALFFETHNGYNRAYDRGSFYSAREESKNSQNARIDLKHKILAFSKLSFIKIGGFFQRAHDSQIPRKLQSLELGVEAARVIFSAVAKLDGVTSALGNIIKNVSQAISHFILESKFVYHTLSVLKLLPIMGIPLAIYDIALHLIKCIKGTMDEKIEAFLLMAADFGIIGECTATFAHGLQRVGAITKHAISWTTPIFAVSLVFSVATLISYMKGWGESIWMLRQLSKKVQGAEEKTIEDFRPLFEYLQKKNNRFLKKQFRLDPIHLRGKLHTAWENAQQVFQVAEATKLEKELALLKLSKIVKSIKQQTIARVAIQSLMISSCLFGVVSGFLFLFTPAAPVAYGLMASGMALSLTSVAVGAYSNFRFRKNLEIQ